MRTRIVNRREMSLWQRIHLKLFGWYEAGEKTYLRCPKHGLAEGYVHGAKKKVDCLACLTNYCAHE